MLFWVTNDDDDRGDCRRDTHTLTHNMDFLRACAKRLDDGEDAAPVLQALRDRYTTVRALSVKTCLVRSFCAPNSLRKVETAMVVE